MKTLYIRNLLGLIFLFSSLWTLGQVTGISYTISPAGEYVWWDNKAGLEDGFLLGLKLGVGFGEYLELRGTYMQAIDQKTSFKNYGIPNFSDSAFVTRGVDLSRWGGELKANFASGNILPFMTLGTGIQSIKLNNYASNQQIYVNLGAGITVSIGDRYTFTLEGKNTPFNFNSGKNLLTQEDKNTFNVTDQDFGENQLKNNWSLNASLQVYLGGRRPGTLSDLDKAYLSTFSDGLTGLRIPVELTMAHINWDENLPYRNTWLGGAYAGIDFGPYIGFRGFYLQSMENGDINLDFDKLAMYGGELRTKLNASRGLVPYLMIGGGYINVGETYIPKESHMTAESQAFALGGVGLDIPISDRFKLVGGVRGLLTSGTNVEDIQSPAEIKTSWMYSFGASLTLGKKAKTPDAVFLWEMDDALEAQRAQNETDTKRLKGKYETEILEIELELNEVYEKNDTARATVLLKEKEESEAILNELRAREAKTRTELQGVLVQSKEQIEALKKEYEEKIVTLEDELNKAYESRDLYKAAELLEEKAVAEADLAEIRKEETQQKSVNQETQKVQQGVTIVPSTSIIQLTPAEFENLIETILENMGTSSQNIAPAINPQSFGPQDMQMILQQQELTRRLDEIKILLIEMTERQASGQVFEEANQTTIEQSIKRDLTEYSAKLLLEIQKLNEKIEQNNKEIRDIIENESRGKQQEIVTPAEEKPEQTVYLSSVTENNVLGVRTGGDYVHQDSGFFSILTYEGMSGFMGFNVGGQTTFNTGFRWHYGISNSKFELMPEAFFGFGSPSAFGLSLNGIYPITIKNSPVTPYLGTGLGFIQIERNGGDNLRFNYNFIFGTYVNVFHGRLYIDYTARNLFKFNQITAGYRFAF